MVKVTVLLNLQINQIRLDFSKTILGSTSVGMINSIYQKTVLCVASLLDRAETLSEWLWVYM